MAGGIGTGLYVSANFFVCCFEGWEEIDTPRRQSGKPERRPTRRVVKAIIDTAKAALVETHRQRKCEAKDKLTFGFVIGYPYRENLVGIAETAHWAEKIINGRGGRR